MPEHNKTTLQGVIADKVKSSNRGLVTAAVLREVLRDLLDSALLRDPGVSDSLGSLERIRAVQDQLGVSDIRDKVFPATGGIAPIVSGATTVSVVFDRPFDTVPTTVTGMISAGPSDPFMSAMLTSVSETGLTFKLSAAAGSSNYALTWSAAIMPTFPDWDADISGLGFVVLGEDPVTVGTAVVQLEVEGVSVDSAAPVATTASWPETQLVGEGESVVEVTEAFGSTYVREPVSITTLAPDVKSPEERGYTLLKAGAGGNFEYTNVKYRHDIGDHIVGYSSPGGGVYDININNEYIGVNGTTVRMSGHLPEAGNELKFKQSLPEWPQVLPFGRSGMPVIIYLTRWTKPGELRENCWAKLEVVGASGKSLDAEANGTPRVSLTDQNRKNEHKLNGCLFTISLNRATNADGDMIYTISVTGDSLHEEWNASTIEVLPEYDFLPFTATAQDGVTTCDFLIKAARLDNSPPETFKGLEYYVVRAPVLPGRPVIPPPPPPLHPD